jgi:hypothetical protein
MKTLNREESETKIDFFFPHLELEDVTNVQQLLNVRFFDSFLSLMKGSCHPTKKHHFFMNQKPFKCIDYYNK